MLSHPWEASDWKIKIQLEDMDMQDEDCIWAMYEWI